MKTPYLFRVSILLLATVFASTLWSKEGCDDPQDPFSPNAVMTAGKHAGKCIDISEIRSFSILSENAEGTTIANISHRQSFWIGHFPKDLRLDRVIFQLERFDPTWIAAHTQLRLKFSAPITLVNQVDSSLVDQIDEIIISVEAVQYVGGPDYGLVRGVRNNFAAAYRLVSLEDKTYHSVVTENNPVNQWLLRIDHNARQKLWQAVLSKNDPNITHMYHTLNFNCTNRLFEMLDEALGHRNRLHQRPMTTLPILSTNLLQQRRLIERRLPDLQEEQEHLLDYTSPL